MSRVNLTNPNAAGTLCSLAAKVQKGLDGLGFCFIRLEFNSNDLQCIHINIHAQVMMGVILGGVTISLYIWQSVKSPEQKI